MEWRLRILTFFILALFAAAGCGGGGTNDPDGNRIEDGGTGGSDGTGGTDGEQCNCPLGQECDDGGECVSSCGAVAACVLGSNFTCCPSETVCDAGSCVVDCGAEPDCNGVCCGDGEMCFEDECVADCENTDNLCGDSSQYCCGDGEACLQEQCIPTGNECDPADSLDLTCTVEEICEFSTETCISRDLIEICEFRPPVGVFTPTLGCRWTPPVTGDTVIDGMSDVVATPSVLDLTDDGDPEIVFVSFDYAANGCCTPKGVVRVISGTCNPDGSMTTLATLKGNPRVGIDTEGFIGNSSGVALGNLHPDSASDERAPEIVSTFRGGGTIAWRRIAEDGTSWEILWQNDSLPTIAHTAGQKVNILGDLVPEKTHGGPQPLIADLNADGQPEVIIGNVVLNGLTGAKIWDGLETAVTARPGVGNNAFVGPVSAVADIDLVEDPITGLRYQEVIAGNTVYAHDGTELWTYEFLSQNSGCGGRLPCDGFTALGNFDDDDEGEVVIIRLGELYVLNHDGTPVETIHKPVPATGVPMPIRIPGWEATPRTYFLPDPDFEPDGILYNENGVPLPDENVPCGGGSTFLSHDENGDVIKVTADFGHGPIEVPLYAVAGGANESGPPTVADFDGDGFAEIGTASSTAYVVFDFQCTGDPLPDDCLKEWVRWMVPNDDCSSRATGSSVFDFEGDGIAEVVYADETTFRIFSGVDGTILYEDDTHSSNTRVEMPIVVDVDNDLKAEVIVPEPNRTDGFGGIDIWKDVENNWVRTRRVWNQHAYSVTNITEDGQIPREPTVNWLNSRLNNFRQNVQPGGLFDAPDFVVRSITRDSCISSTTDLTIVVGNDGALSVPDGIKVFVEITGSVTEEYVLETTEWLLPGQSEALQLEINAPGASVFTVSVTVDEDGEGNDQYNECFEDNNTLTTPITACGVQ